jgi:hypothetical protein
LLSQQLLLTLALLPLANTLRAALAGAWFQATLLI